MLELRYFAWLRERIGTASETVETQADTLAGLIEELRARGPAHAHVFEDVSAIRAAIDHELADLDASIADAREVAFFPPMTGG